MKTQTQQNKFIAFIIVIVKVFAESRNNADPAFDYVTQQELDEIAKKVGLKHHRKCSRQVVKMLLFSGVIQPFKGKTSAFHPKFKTVHSDFEMGYTLCKPKNRSDLMDALKKQKEIEDVAAQDADTADTSREDWDREFEELLEQRKVRIEKDETSSYLASLNIEQLWQWIKEQNGVVISDQSIGEGYFYETYKVGDYFAKVFYEKKWVGMWMIIVVNSKLPEPIIKFSK